MKLKLWTVPLVALLSGLLVGTVEADDQKEGKEKKGVSVTSDVQVRGKIIVVGPDGQKQEIEFDGGKPLQKLRVLQLGEQGSITKRDADAIVGSGEVLRLRIEPNGGENQVAVVVDRSRSMDNAYVVGLVCEVVPEAVRAQLHLGDDEGLIVQQVIEATPAEKAGFEKYDILVSAGDTALNSVEGLVAAVQQSKGGKILFRLIRKGKEKSIAVKPAKRESLYSGSNSEHIKAILETLGAGDVKVQADDLKTFEKLKDLRLRVVRPGITWSDKTGDVNRAVRIRNLLSQRAGGGEEEKDDDADESKVDGLAKKLDSLSRQLKLLQKELRALREGIDDDDN